MRADSTSEIEVSIVICTRNRANRLEDTLNSLRALRSHHAYEVIWVDNASTDGTAAVLQRECANNAASRYVLGKRIGLGAARNEGWKAASGRLVALTDDDCYPAPDYVDAIVAAFADHSDAGAIGGRILLYNPKHARITIDEDPLRRTYLRRTFVHPGALHGANIVFRRTTLETIGGIDPELGAGTRFPCEDIDAVTAVLWAGFNVYFDPRPVVYHDHGRIEADIPALLGSYDRGRGSFFAKYILRPDTRATFAMRWLRSAWNRRGWGGLRTLRTEMSAAAEYAISKKRYDAVLLAAPLCLTVLAFQAMMSLFVPSDKPTRPRELGG